MLSINNVKHKTNHHFFFNYNSYVIRDYQYCIFFIRPYCNTTYIDFISTMETQLQVIKNNDRTNVLIAKERVIKVCLRIFDYS